MVDDIDDPSARLLTTAEAATAAHVDEQDIRNWARPSRALLTPADHDPEGRPLYREIDVLEAERHTRRAARRSRLADEASHALAGLTAIGT
jgi:hypothetical protein